MPRNRAGIPVIQDAFYWAFYWIGIVMVAACILLVLTGNTDTLWRFEHARIPLSWAAGVVGILALVVAEFCGSVPPVDATADLSREAAHPEILHQEWT